MESKLLKLFRYADILDILTMLLGTIFGIMSGTGLPLVVLVYGFVLTEFIDYSIALQVKTGNAIRDFCNTSGDTGFIDYLKSTDPVDMLEDEVPRYTYYTLGLAIMIFVSSSLSRLLWSVSATRQSKKMRLDYFKSVLTKHVGWFDTTSIELHSPLSECVRKIEDGIGQVMATFVREISTFLSCFIIGFAINWKLTLVTSTLLPPMVLFALITRKFISKFTERKQESLANASSVANEVLSAIKTVKAFDGEEKEIERYHSHLKQAKRESYKILILGALTFSVLASMIFQYFALGFWYASRLFVDCSITAGDILLVVLIVMLGTFTLAELVPDLKQLSEAKGHSELVYEVIDQESEINPDSDDGIIPASCEGGIQFSDVIFSYPSRPDVQILHGLDLSIKPGQTVALVGPTGCGKSTVSRLIPRIYEFNGGTISLDGHSIRELNVRWLRNQIGIVSQEPVLFNVSIAENISYGKEDATMEEIEMAAKFANAHDFISELPDGYNTLVGEGGDQLSGGQKQRIAIARALVRDPKILLLDEATSALDAENVKVVQDALNKAREGRTTIIITHQLPTIQTADVIIAIDKGRIVEMGSHDELMANGSGLYYGLVMNQNMEANHDNGEDFALAMRKTVQDKSLIKSMSISFTKPKVARCLGTTDIIIPYEEDRQLGEIEMQFMQGDEIRLPRTVNDSTKEEEERKNYLKIFKDLFVLCFDKIHWFFVILAVIAFISAGVLFSVNFALLNGLVEQFSELVEEDLIRGVEYYAIIFASIAFTLFFVYIIGIISFGIGGEQLAEKVREKSFIAMVKQHLSWFHKPENAVGALMHRLTVDATNIYQIMELRMGSAIRSFATVFGAVIVTFVTTWALTLLLLPAYFSMFIGAYLQVSLTKKYADSSKKLIEDSAKVTSESIDNVYTVATLGIERRLVKKYDECLEQPLMYTLKSDAINGILYGLSKAAIFVCIGISYIVGFHLFTADTNAPYYADAAQIFTAIAIVLLTSRMFKSVFDALPDTYNAVKSAESVVLLTSQQPIEDEYHITPDEINGDLEFKQIYFDYPSRPGVFILKGLDFSVKSGQTLALVGPSGSGKSTIVSLIERFYDSKTGDILLDGVDINDLNISWLRRQISLVSQEPVLFDMSIADNIRYGALFREVSDDEIMEVAKSANIHDFIQSLPEGYSTNVGLKGTQLSGGQKQRVAIARALVRDPKIFLLDEATSALDAENEKIVQDALDKAREGRTTIIIAHRLSTIYNSDSIAVLHNGRVIEQGTHSELMAQQGAYYFMNNIQ